jgi:Flp pilus assembly pilin Flp
MKNLFKRIRKQTAGVILLEYVMLGLLVAVVSMYAVTAFGTTISNDFITLAIASTGDGASVITSNVATRTAIAADHAGAASWIDDITTDTYAEAAASVYEFTASQGAVWTAVR